MNWILFLVALIAIEHVLIGLVEMFGNTKLQSRMFEMDSAFLEQKNAKIALENQGIYNVMFGLLIVAFLFFVNVPTIAIQLLMLFIVVVGIYGGMTVTRKILLVQALPALVAFLLLFINN